MLAAFVDQIEAVGFHVVPLLVRVVRHQEVALVQRKPAGLDLASTLVQVHHVHGDLVRFRVDPTDLDVDGLLPGLLTEWVRHRGRHLTEERVLGP